MTSQTSTTTTTLHSRSSSSSSSSFIFLLALCLSLIAAISSPLAANAQDTTLASESLTPSTTSDSLSGSAVSSGSSLPDDTTVSPSTSLNQISSLPTSSFPTTASSNFTAPSGALTASFPANFTYASSNPYQMVAVNVFTIASQLPVPVYYSLANESVGTRAAICAQQVDYCAKAGCAESGTTIRENFCNNVTLASQCSCTKGDSNLPYYHWPVAVADCTNRASACNLACSSSTVSVVDRANCTSTCNSMLRVTCGTPGQVSANYAVGSSSDIPSLNYVQGTTGSAAAALVIRTAMAMALSGLLFTGFTLILL